MNQSNSDGISKGRSKPVHGVLRLPSQPAIVFVTVCTKNRVPWLATDEIHQLLTTIWKNSFAWHVGRYVILPDHIHLFASPGDQDVSLENWIRYWKSQFSKRHGNDEHRWQSDHWDTRLRQGESYEAKWEYVRNNPVRHQLVSRAEDWPYQGEINLLPWY